MRVTVLYFARLRDAIGHERDAFDLPESIVTLGSLRTWLIARGAPWATAFDDIKRVRAAVDQKMATDATPLRDGAEVAFFPPVTGG
jgi:molybdopterin synthase sulfur carrier subunit